MMLKGEKRVILIDYGVHMPATVDISQIPVKCKIGMYPCLYCKRIKVIDPSIDEMCVRAARAMHEWTEL